MWPVRGRQWSLPAARNRRSTVGGVPLYSEHGLRELVSTLDATQPEHLNNAVLAAVAAFRGGAPAQDDETLLVLHHNAADPPLEMADNVGPATAA